MKNLNNKDIPNSEIKLLENLREQIDQLDEKLVHLFDERAALVFKVGDWKKRNHYEIHDPEREKKILEKVSNKKLQNLNTYEIQSLFIKLMEFFRNTEKAHALISQTQLKESFPKKGVFGFAGFGLIGASTGLALCKQFPEWKFLIFDPNLKNDEFEKWNTQNAQGKFEIVNLEQLRDTNYLFLAAPIDINQELAQALVKCNKIVLNLGSFQANLKDVIGFHPLAGKEVTGYHAAQSDLFYNKVICITHSEFCAKENITLIQELANLMGADSFITTNETHNLSLAYTSHVIQILSMVFGNTLETQGFSEKVSLIPATAKEFLRLNGSDVKMWEPIIRKNHKNILKAFNDFEKNWREIKIIIQQSGDDSSPSQGSENTKDSFRKINTHFKNLKDLFVHGHEVYKKLYLKKGSK